MALASATLVICERILTEADGTISAIRIVDLYSTPLEPSAGKPVILGVPVLGVVKFTADDQDEHSAQLKILRPNNETANVGPPSRYSHANNSSVHGDIVRGFNIEAHIRVVARQTGTYYVMLFIDEREVARSPFTLLRQSQQQQDEQADAEGVPEAEAL